ncbi:MAG: hypothetical protein QFX35_01230 [Candidatus Verstraetearchaeota archaeon]|nr:hypothetical protein [Candidatus Verstraetearchaeota archaeon]
MKDGGMPKKDPWNWAVFALISSMAVTLLIPASVAPISLWSEIGPLQYLRSLVWLAGLTYLPGGLFMRITGLDQRVGWGCAIPLSVCLSFAFNGLFGFFSNYLFGSISTFPVLAIVITSLMFALSTRFKEHPPAPKISPPHCALILAAASSSAISGLVFARHLYLIPGDQWVAITPAVELINGVDVWNFFHRSYYPVFFGFMIAGYSVSMGIPVVNANALFFLLSGLNVLVFYAMAKRVFKMTDSSAVLASLLYSFSAGLGYFIHTFIFPKLSFWTVSNITQDMYFMPFAWGAIDLTYKMISVVQVFSSFAIFIVALGSTRIRQSLSAIFASAVLFLSSFLIHMLPGFLAPVFLLIFLFASPTRKGVFSLFLLAASSAAVFLGIELMTGWLNTSLLVEKIPFFAISTRFALLALGGVAGLTILAVAFSRLRARMSSRVLLPAASAYVKLLFIIMLASAYASGLPYLLGSPSAPEVSVEFTFPLYLYITRYGILGFLALIGAAVVSWKEGWFKIAAAWAGLALLLGSLWWGTRMNAFLHPALSILGAYGVLWLWKRLPERSPARILRLPVRAGVAILVALSFTSTLYLDYHYAVNDPKVPEDLVALLRWLNENTPQDSLVLYPDYSRSRSLDPSNPTVRWQFARGITTISDRDLRAMTNLNETGESIRSFYDSLDPSRQAYVVLMRSYETPAPVEKMISEPLVEFNRFSVHALIPYGGC